MLFDRFFLTLWIENGEAFFTITSTMISFAASTHTRIRIPETVSKFPSISGSIGAKRKVSFKEYDHIHTHCPRSPRFSKLTLHLYHTQASDKRDHRLSSRLCIVADSRMFLGGCIQIGMGSNKGPRSSLYC